MKKLLPFLFLLIFFPCFTDAQDFSPPEVDRKLQTLSDKDKVEFINENFYKIYSADFVNAKRLAQFATTTAAQNGWKDQEAYGYMNQGVVTYLKGEYDEALPFFIRSSKLFDSLHDAQGLARVYNEMAVFFSKQKQMDAAYQHVALALEHADVAGDLTARGTALHHKAVFLEREGKNDEAFRLYQEVYTIRLKQKDSVGLGYILQDLALIEAQKQNFKKAIQYIDQSSAIRKKIGDKQGLAVSYVNAGETYYAAENYPEAIRSFYACLVVAKEVGYTDLVKYTYDQLALAHTHTGDYKKAFEMQGRARHMQDSLFNLDRTKVIADMQTRYETEKRIQEIELQRATVAEQRAELERNFVIIVSLAISLILLVVIILMLRNRAARKQELLRKEHDVSLRDALIKASIQSQETERKRFAQDLHDGMGQLISSLRLSVASLGDKELSAEERVHIFSKSENILQEMHREIRGIAFNLMPQTLIQAGLVPALEEMAQKINESGKLIITVKGFDIPQRLEEVQEISLYRVIQEWISNIMKYAEATSIEVQLVGYENEITIVVEDNGKGFDPSILGKGSGHGWRNIQSRLSLIRSQIEVDSREGIRGTTVVIHLPHNVKVHALNSKLQTQLQ